MIIDSHAHLNSYDNELETIVQDMETDGLEKIINIGTSVSDCKDVLDVAIKNKNVYATVGIHPEYADSVTEEDYNYIDKLANHEKVVAIGEIGLDYHYTQENKDKQKDVFIKQIKLAKKHNLPICIHTREAREDTYQILKDHKEDLIGGVMHCFSENGEYAKKFIDLGFYISFAGNITFKKVDRSFIKDIPLDRILVETDAPYLSPEPMRGRTNYPARVNLTAEKIADTLEMDVEEFKKITIENTYRLFKKMKRD